MFLAAMSLLPSSLYIMRLTLGYYPKCSPLSLPFLNLCPTPSWRSERKLDCCIHNERPLVCKNIRLRISIIDGVMHSKCLLMRISFADFLTYIRICGFVGGAGKWICPRVEIEFVQAAPVLLNHRWWAAAAATAFKAFGSFRENIKMKEVFAADRMYLL